jgi:microsomal dipeptidase-like Zn-dependent dipeptidase
VIADLHAHYPMHLRRKLRGSLLRLVASAPGRWRLLDAARSLLVRTASLFGNYQRYDTGPRVTVPLLHSGGVGLALSVLYSPFDEIDLGKRYGSPPNHTYFPTLIRQLEDVEAEVAGEHPGRARIVRHPDELKAAADGGEVALVHCVEGGFHLGGAAEEIDRNVAELAARGCFYVTLAHLFYRSLATNVNAIPFLPDWVYDLLFPMPDDVGLTELGRAAVRSLVRHRVLIDLSHMREPGLDESFALLDQLDPERTVPVIASHAGYRFGSDRYNLSPETIERIADRDGVIGVILSIHQAADGLGYPRNLDDSLAVVFRHVDRIRDIVGSHRHTAIGSDLDGFIKPTLPGLEDARDLARLETALIARYGPEHAELITSGNVIRLAHTYWRGGLPPESPPPPWQGARWRS